MVALVSCVAGGLWAAAKLLGIHLANARACAPVRSNDHDMDADVHDYPAGQSAISGRTSRRCETTEKEDLSHIAIQDPTAFPPPNDATG